MDWLERMSAVIEYIEEHLKDKVEYEYFGRIFCCSVYEFSRMFSFITGISLSEYIRRRRLSQAALDIQQSDARIMDVALQYGYESQAAFTRAFKELMGQAPSAARRPGVVLRIYPKLSFILKIEGAEEMKYRIEEREAFQIVGLKGQDGGLECAEGDQLTLLWRDFMDHYNTRLWKGGYYKAPFWQVGAYAYQSNGGNTDCIIGAELGNLPVPEGMETQEIPAAKWLVFPVQSLTGINFVPAAYARILKWLPESGFERNQDVPNLEVFPGGEMDETYVWEIWIPIV